MPLKESSVFSSYNENITFSDTFLKKCHTPKRNSLTSIKVDHMIKGRFKGFLPAILWSIVIIVLSTLPGKTMNSFSFSDLWNVDKLGHLVVYAIHCFLLLRGYRHLTKEILNRQVISALLWSVFLGFSLEIIQYSFCLLYTSPSPRDKRQSRMPSSA